MHIAGAALIYTNYGDQMLALWCGPPAGGILNKGAGGQELYNHITQVLGVASLQPHNIACWKELGPLGWGLYAYL